MVKDYFIIEIFYNLEAVPEHVCFFLKNVIRNITMDGIC